MTLAHDIALATDWDNPSLAGFAAAFVDLSMVGQSFNKTAGSMFGTLVASFFALTFIALFHQGRWLFMLALSIYVGLCGYHATGQKHQYYG